jgi:hypothetical protein
MSAEQDVQLNDMWTLYFHDPNNEDWNLSSYQRLVDISTVHDFLKVTGCLKDKLKSGMFFMMREHIFPCWDDDNNVNGGCLSIKVAKDQVVSYWDTLCARMLGETLLSPDIKDKWDVVNGVSISPKRYFCIIKVWLRTSEYGDPKFFRIPESHYGDVIFRDNLENIQKNHDQLLRPDAKEPKEKKQLSY